MQGCISYEHIPFLPAFTLLIHLNLYLAAFWFESLIQSSSLLVLDVLWTKTEGYAASHGVIKHMDCFLLGIEPRLWNAFGF